MTAAAQAVMVGAIILGAVVYLGLRAWRHVVAARRDRGCGPGCGCG